MKLKKLLLLILIIVLFNVVYVFAIDKDIVNENLQQWELLYGYERVQEFVDNYEEYSQYQIDYYSVPKEIYRSFIKEPSIELLNNGEKKRFFYLNVDDGFYCDNYFGAITVENINFYCTKNLQKVLNDNNIYEKIKNYVLVSTDISNNSDIPVTLWIETMDGNDYFIELGYDDTKKIKIDKSIFSLYQEYYDKYKQYDGKVYVNGNEVLNADYIKFEGKGVLVPFRTIMEAMGSKVVWDEGTRSVKFSVNEEWYIWRRLMSPAIISAKEGKVVYENFYTTEFYNDSIIINDLRLCDLVNLYGGVVEIDYSTYCIYINF